MSTHFQFARIRQILKELKETTGPKEDYQYPEYIDELREEADEVISKIENEFAKLSIKLLERPK